MTLEHLRVWFSAHTAEAPLFLLDLFAKSSLVLISAWLTTLLLRRKSAAARHLTWAAAMCGLLVIPVVSLLGPRRDVPVLPAAAVRLVTPTHPEVVARSASTPDAPASASPASAEPTRVPPTADTPRPDEHVAGLDGSVTSPTHDPREADETSPGANVVETAAARTNPSRAPEGGAAPGISWTWPMRLAATWAAGAALALLPILLGSVAVRLLTVRAPQITSGPWLESFDALRRRLGVRPVMLLETGASSMPMAWGLVRPTLLLPAPGNTWGPDRRRAVLAHELAHVKRFDCLTQWAGELACCLYWFNPLAWYALRRMRMERERACDDLVLRLGSRPSDYAGHLLDVARTLRSAPCAGLAAVAMARPSQLEGRLLALLDEGRDHRGLSRFVLASACAGLLLLIGPLASVRLAAREPASESVTAAKDPAPPFVANSAGTNEPPPTENPQPVEGWKSVADPVNLVSFKPDLKSDVTVRHRLIVAGVERPSPFVALGDFDWPHGQVWQLLDLRDGGVKQVLDAPVQLEEPVASPDGELLAGKKPFPAAGFEVWSLKTGRLVRSYDTRNLGGSPAVLGFLDGNLVLTLSTVDWKPVLNVWETKGDAPVATVRPGSKLDPQHVAISPGGKFVAALEDDRLRIFSAKGEATDDIALAPPSEPGMQNARHEGKAVAFSADGKEVAALLGIAWHADKFRLLAWDTATGRVTVDRIVPALGDDRWTRHERKFESAGATGWRYNRQILDRQTGRSIYTLPQTDDGAEDEAYRVLDAGHVLRVSPTRQNSVSVAAVALPKDELARATAVVRAGGREADAGLPPLTKADWAAVQVLTASGQSGAWAVEPDASDAAAPADLFSVPLKFSPPVPGGGTETLPHRVVFGGSDPAHAVVGYRTFVPRGNLPIVRSSTIEPLNPHGGPPAWTLPFPVSADPLDVSPDGKQLLVRTGPDRLDLYAVNGGSPRPLAAWRPYEKDADDKSRSGAVLAPGREADVIFGAILDAGHVLTCSAAGKLALWDVPACRAVYQVQLAPNAEPKLSRRRKLLAGCNGAGIALLDPSTGHLLGTLDGPPANNAESLALSPDGSSVARYIRIPYPLVSVWDLKTGRLTTQCLPDKPTSDPSVAFCGIGYVMAGRQTLLDEAKHVPVWRFETDPIDARGLPGGDPAELPAVGNPPDGRWWCLTPARGAEPPAIVGVPLPPAAATATLAAIAPLSIEPGSKVTLEVNTGAEDTARQNVVALMTRQLRDAGFEPAEGQAVKLVTQLTFKGTRKVEYHLFGRPQKEVVQVPQYDVKVSFVKDGTTLWEAGSKASDAPFFIHLKQGQSAQDYINTLNANPGGEFLQHCALPRYVAKNPAPLNASRLTRSGAVAEP